MAVLRTLLVSLAILAAGFIILAAATHGFRAFTSETARRIAIREQPRPVPPVALQAASGRTMDFASLNGRWLLVNFIYTRCRTYCSLQGSAFAHMQKQFTRSIEADNVLLLSISFDPGHDNPARLTDYKHRFGNGRDAGWIAARPTSAPGLETLKRIFKITVIPDPLGGYLHNAGIWIVDPRGQLVAIFDRDKPDKAVAYVRDRLAG